MDNLQNIGKHNIFFNLVSSEKKVLYYLASKNVYKESEGCGFRATYEVAVCWKNMYSYDYNDGYYYQGTTPWVVMIGGKMG